VVFVVCRASIANGYFFYDGQMKYAESQPMDLPYASVKEAVRETPAFAEQAAKVAIGLSIGVGILVFFGTWALSMALDITSPWRPAAALGGISMILCILYWAFEGVERITWQRETVTGHDINNDGFIGQPTKTDFLIVEEHYGDGNHWTTSELPLPEDRQVLCDWINAAVARRSLAAEQWEQRFGHTYPHGLKTSVYTLFKEQALKSGWLIDRGSHGVVLSNEGRKVFARQLEQMALPESVE
jgi:hypothetical protein